MTELICIVCPKGCHLKVDEAHDFAVRGHSCARGIDYGQSELRMPMRTLTSTVLLTGAALRRCPVRTSAPIPKAKLAEAMAALDALRVAAPVAMGQVLLADVCGTGADIIATRAIAQEG